jgi:hypothetical protein
MENVDVLLEPIRASLHQIGEFLPRLLLALAILILGWLLAKFVRFVIVRMLRAVNFNVLTEKAGVDKFLQQGGGELDTVRLLGLLFYWLVILACADGRVQQHGAFLRHRSDRPHPAVRAEGDGRDPGDRVRRVLRALHRHRGHDVRQECRPGRCGRRSAASRCGRSSCS